jgi:Domain of unknown function (DUF4440)
MARNDEKTIIDLETKFWQSIVDQDTEAAVGMLDDKSMVAGPQGLALLSRDDYRSMAEKDKSWRLKSFKLDDVKVSFPNQDVAVIAYQVAEEMAVDGKTLTMKAADATTWVRKGGKWLAVMHTESLLGDPFGRDRKAA